MELSEPGNGFHVAGVGGHKVLQVGNLPQIGNPAPGAVTARPRPVGARTVAGERPPALGVERCPVPRAHEHLGGSGGPALVPPQLAPAVDAGPPPLPSLML